MGNTISIQWAIQYQLIHKQYQWMGNIVPMGVYHMITNKIPIRALPILHKRYQWMGNIVPMGIYQHYNQIIRALPIQMGI